MGENSVTQYGVRAAASGAVFIVTTNYLEAAQALEWVAGGRIVSRTITYGDWLLADGADLQAPLPRSA